MTTHPARAVTLITSLVAVLCLLMAASAGDRPAPRLIRSVSYDASSTASIAVGSSLDQVHAVFGALPDELDGGCFYSDSSGATIHGVAKTLRYPGLMISVEKYPGWSEYKTTRIEIRGPNLWITPGLTVGMSRASLEALLGRADLSAVDANTGEKILHYSFDADRIDLRIHLKRAVVTVLQLNTREWPTAG